MSAPFIHPTAVVDPGATLEDDVKVWHFSHVMSEAVIERGAMLGQNAFIGRGVRIGPQCRLQNNVSVYEGVTLEEGVFCGPSCVFTNDLTPRALHPKHGAYVPTLVRRGASIGANATIVCGTTIGQHAMIGAGAVVTRDVPDHALVVGVPATQVGWVCECGEVLALDAGRATCRACERAYRFIDGRLEEA